METMGYLLLIMLFLRVSFLSPILFTIFINDLPISFTSNVKIFADDDTKIYNTSVNYLYLQEDLNLLME